MNNGPISIIPFRIIRGIQYSNSLMVFLKLLTSVVFYILMNNGPISVIPFRIIKRHAI